MPGFTNKEYAGYADGSANGIARKAQRFTTSDILIDIYCTTKHLQPPIDV